uniref:Uncharacterized protein n=1 Tax=Neisseria meningitidis alpha153 TaxID=663926 RepID=C6SEX0_NEIME|nr:hypothetical protein predicted by Glimmer/Critica [Neisseria meningitidis alpha153]
MAVSLNLFFGRNPEGTRSAARDTLFRVPKH